MTPFKPYLIFPQVYHSRILPPTVFSVFFLRRANFVPKFTFPLYIFADIRYYKIKKNAALLRAGKKNRRSSL